MKKEILEVPHGIRYISEWCTMEGGYKLENYQFPHMVNKQITGCGFTEYCLTNSLDTIICSPRKILLENKVDYEFRTTIVKEFHEIDDFILIGQSIKGAKRYFLQSYQDKDSVLTPNLHPLSKEELLKCLEVVKKYVLNASLRGID